MSLLLPSRGFVPGGAYSRGFLLRLLKAREPSGSVYLVSKGLEREVSLSALRRWLHAEAMRLGDEGLGLGARPIPVGVDFLQACSLVSTEKLEAAIDVYARYGEILGLPVRFSAEVAGCGLRVVVTAEAINPLAGAFLEELSLARMYVALCWATQTILPTTAVTSPLGDHPAMGRRHPVIQGVLTPSERVGLIFDPAATHVPIQTDAPPASPAASMDWFCGEVSYTLGTPEVQVGDLAVAPDRLAHLSFSNAASGLEVSDRQGRRRLKTQYGRNFRDMRHEALEKVALSLLTCTDLSLEEIAERLGYEEARSFRRFIKSRTGLSPREIRSLALRSGSAKAPDSSLL